VYVDVEPVAVAHSELILAGNEWATVIQEDLRHPKAILEHPKTRALLDFDQPIGLLLVSVLHAIPDQDDPAGVVARLGAALGPGSYVAISHFTADSRPAEVNAATRMSQQTTTPIMRRTRAQVEGFFAGLDMVEPGLVWAPQWRPDYPDEVDEPRRSSLYAGVGRKA
jgi:hypothetical protein